MTGIISTITGKGFLTNQSTLLRLTKFNFACFCHQAAKWEVTNTHLAKHLILKSINHDEIFAQRSFAGGN